MKKNQKIIIISIIVLIFIAIGVSATIYAQSQLINIQQWILQFGALAPLIIILMHLIETLIPPIPGAIPSGLAGFLYGPVYGTLLAWFADVFSAAVAFWTIRKIGKDYLLKKIHKYKYNKYLDLLEDYGVQIVVISRFIPYFHKDILSMVLGITNMKLRTFILAFSIGSLVTSFWTATIGSSFLSINKTPIIIGLILVIIAAIYLHKKGAFKEIKKRP